MISIYHANLPPSPAAGVTGLGVARALREPGHRVDLYASFLDRDVPRFVSEGAGWCQEPGLVRGAAGYGRVSALPR